MKRLITISSFAILASCMVMNPAWAGVNYIQYHEDFQAQKSGAGPSEDSKHLQHQSKSQRDTQDQAVPPSPQGKESNKPAGKYDRRYWNPTE